MEKINLNNLIDESIRLSKESLVVEDPVKLTGSIINMGQQLIYIKDQLNKISFDLIQNAYLTDKNLSNKITKIADQIAKI